jgi:hypothetical protein
VHLALYRALAGSYTYNLRLFSTLHSGLLYRASERQNDVKRECHLPSGRLCHPAHCKRHLQWLLTNKPNALSAVPPLRPHGTVSPNNSRKERLASEVRPHLACPPSSRPRTCKVGGGSKRNECTEKWSDVLIIKVRRIKASNSERLGRNCTHNTRCRLYLR